LREELPLSVGPASEDLPVPKPFAVDQREFPASEISGRLNFQRSVSSRPPYSRATSDDSIEGTQFLLICLFFPTLNQFCSNRPEDIYAGSRSCDAVQSGCGVEEAVGQHGIIKVPESLYSRVLGEFFMVRKAEVGGRLLLRLPKEIKSWIEQEAAYNGSSQNSEIIRCVRSRMDSQRPVSRFESLSAGAAD
jgi:hypothetical protein